MIMNDLILIYHISIEMNFSADIISLQEVEMEQFYNFFLLELKRDGYEVSILQKYRMKLMI